jgi:hypothetical protein
MRFVLGKFKLIFFLLGIEKTKKDGFVVNIAFYYTI